MAPVILSSLSPELICLILQKVHSGRDLHAFVQTSSYIYQAFTASKDSILWNLAKCSMVPEVLVEAVTATKLRNMQCGFEEVEINFDEISSLATEVILTGGNKDALPHNLMSSVDILTLHQVQSAVEYFIDGYCSQQLPVLFPPGTDAAFDLSTTELARLQRAFYRYDVCQTMWYYPGRFHHDWPYRTSRYDAHALLSRLKLWEVEEIACVWQYIHQRLQGVLNAQGQKLLESIVATSSAKQAEPGKGSESKLEGPDEAELRPRFEEGSDDFIFSRDGKMYQAEHITYLAARPLPFLQYLCQSEADQQRLLIFEYQRYAQDHLCRVLEKDLKSRPHKNGQKFQGGKLSACNRAWEWRFEKCPTSRLTLAANFDLRTWGFVFWDKDRLESSGLLHQSQPALDRWPSLPSIEPSKEPSIEQKLQEMNLADGWDLVAVRMDEY